MLNPGVQFQQNNKFISKWKRKKIRNISVISMYLKFFQIYNLLIVLKITKYKAFKLGFIR